MLFDAANTATSREGRVIGKHGAYADHDGIGHGPHEMHAVIGAGTGDGGTNPAGGRDETVRRERHLELDEGPAEPHPGEMAAMVEPRLVLAEADIDIYAVGAQHGEAAPAHARVRISDGADDAHDAGAGQRVRTGRRAAVVRAGFKRHIGCRATGRSAGMGDGGGFAMRTAARLGQTTAHDGAIAHQHAADGRIRPGEPEPAPAKA